MNRICFLIFFFSLGVVFGNDDFIIQITPSSNEISVDDIFSINILASCPKEFKLDTESLSKNLTSILDQEHFFLASKEIKESKIIGDVRQQEVIYKLEPWATKKSYIVFSDVLFVPINKNLSPVNIPSDVLVINVGFPKNSKLTLEPAQPVSLTKESIVSDDNKIYLQREARKFFEEKKEKEVFASKQPPWKWLFLAFLSCGAFVGSRKFISYSKRKRLEKEMVFLSPTEKALLAINNLQRQNLIPKEFYVKLTHIVRLYIEEKYNIKAPEKTTEEFLNDAMQSSYFDSKAKIILTNFLTHADLVKFAQLKPQQEEINKMLVTAKSLVVL